MLIINGKAMLKIGNRYIAPGEEFEADESLGKKLKDVGLATATAEAEETATMGGKPDVPKPNNTPGKRTPKPRAGKRAPKN